MRWIYAALALYWLSAAVATGLAALGHSLIPPDAVREEINETAALPYHERFLNAAADVALVAALSYPALFIISASYGVATAAIAGAMGLGYAVLYAAVANITLAVLGQVAAWHPLARRAARRKVEWGRYLLWVAFALSLVAVLAL